MMSIVYIIILILMLGIIIFIHELGHFFFARLFKVYIYEFSLGMGPVVYSKLGKDNIRYNIRLIPIGGFVSMAGEVYEDDETNKIPKEDFMCNKKWYQRLIILVAGVVNNYILAIIVLFIFALVYGGATSTNVVDYTLEEYPAYAAGLEAGDTILEINGYAVSSWDRAQIILAMEDDDNVYEFLVQKDKTDEEVLIEITPLEEEVDGVTSYIFGIGIKTEEYVGIFGSLKYAFVKFASIVDSMMITLYALFTGLIGIGSLAGPIGMYQVVESVASVGFYNLLYLLAFLSINVGILNILPFPAFDGGRVLFLIIEKIKGSPVNSKIENIAHLIGFILLIALSIFVAFNDVLRLL